MRIPRPDGIAEQCGEKERERERGRAQIGNAFGFEADPAGERERERVQLF